jgi:hypothetical protein
MHLTSREKSKRWTRMREEKNESDFVFYHFIRNYTKTLLSII